MKGQERLFSLDALRGLDMIFLCIVQPLVVALANAWGVADVAAHPFMRQFHHFWGGFTAYDLIMPLFIFMCGAAIPYALPKRLDDKGRPGGAFWKHVSSRMVLLWILGMACQGNLLTYDPRKFYFSNTLQSIAVGYLVTALVFVYGGKALRLIAPCALALTYGVLLHFGGDYSVDGNMAMRVDMFVVRAIQPFGHDTGSYTWYLTSFMFAAMTLCGMHAAHVLKSSRSDWGKVLILVITGVVSIAGGWILEVMGIPRIKHIFTVSFTLQAMGACFLALAGLYAINDVWKIRRGWWLVTLFGQCALAAYVVGEIFRSVLVFASHALAGGLSLWFGDKYESVIVQLGAAGLLTAALAMWRRVRFAR